MKTTILVAILASTVIAKGATAQDAITEFRIGILGGENAQDRMNSCACLQDYASDALGVETRLLRPPITTALFRACWVARLTWRGLGRLAVAGLLFSFLATRGLAPVARMIPVIRRIMDICAPCRKSSSRLC